MDIKTFGKLAESLRQYRRAELKDFEQEIGSQPVDSIYVDPLPSNAVLETVLSSNTTYILGRKGTGKSTIFSKAQSEIRRLDKDVSIYIDVKSLYELLGNSETPVTEVESQNIDSEILRTHLLRKHFLGSALADLIKELKDTCQRLSLFQRWMGKKREIQEALEKLSELETEVKRGKLSKEELPILQLITKKTKERVEEKEKTESSTSGNIKSLPIGISSEISGSMSDLDETLTDNEVYSEYSDAVLRSFPFAEFMSQIKDLLDEIGMNRLIIFFDDFSEITWVNQRLFVDIVLSPLNNSSDEKIKLKVAGYPGRVYYGNIDPGKIDTINLDFSSVYKSQDVQTMESNAINYTSRLLNQRFESFGLRISEYFDPVNSQDEYMRTIFEASFNVPRIMGFILYYCYRDKIAHNQQITISAIRLACQKYYDDVLKKYFDKMNRFALEPFERKLDRHNQQDLLWQIISEAKKVRRGIQTKEIGGSYFEGITNPPASHFSISNSLEKILESLEMNFLVAKYHEMRDKDGKEVLIYALFYGLCESEKIPWGYPKGRRADRSYFVQRCFSYNTTIHSFIAKRQTIRCKDCGASFPMEKKDSFELYKFKCPECRNGICSIINLSDDYKGEFEKLDQAIMLEPVELDILNVLQLENRKMRSGEISKFVDQTYQFIGKRTAKLRDAGLVIKDSSDGPTKNSISEKGKNVYFSEE